MTFAHEGIKCTCPARTTGARMKVREHFTFPAAMSDSSSDSDFSSESESCTDAEKHAEKPVPLLPTVRRHPLGALRKAPPSALRGPRSSRKDTKGGLHPSWAATRAGSHKGDSNTYAPICFQTPQKRASVLLVSACRSLAAPSQEHTASCTATFPGTVSAKSESGFVTTKNLLCSACGAKNPYGLNCSGYLCKAVDNLWFENAAAACLYCILSAQNASPPTAFDVVHGRWWEFGRWYCGKCVEAKDYRGAWHF